MVITSTRRVCGRSRGQVLAAALLPTTLLILACPVQPATDVAVGHRGTGATPEQSGPEPERRRLTGAPSGHWEPIYTDRLQCRWAIVDADGTVSMSEWTNRNCQEVCR